MVGRFEHPLDLSSVVAAGGGGGWDEVGVGGVKWLT